jgi:signal transduction histidine kinase
MSIFGEYKDSEENPAHFEVAYLKAKIAKLQKQLEQTKTKEVISELKWHERQTAISEERLRIARQLHDSLQQDLYGIELGVITGRQLLKQKKEEEVEAQFALILLIAEGALNELRSLIFDLRPDALGNTGLVVGLSQHITTLRTRHHLEVESKLGPEPAIALKIKEALYWIAREALLNIVKHARATKVKLALNCNAAGQVSLEISDNGVGFDPNIEHSEQSGLKSMQERASELGLDLVIQSNIDGQGSTICACWPGYIN